MAVSDREATQRSRQGAPAAGRSGEHTIQRLIGAASVEFGRHGYEGARIERISKRAKANKQLIYYHFGSKQALYRVVVERAYLAFLHGEKDWDAALAGLDAEAALRKVASTIFQPSPALQRLQRLIHDANMRGNRPFEVDIRVKFAFDRLLDVLASILKRGADEGVFQNKIDATELYIFMLGALGTQLSNASTISAALGTDLISRQGLEASQRWALDFLIHGLRPVNQAK